MSKILDNYIQSLEKKLERLKNPETTEDEQKQIIVSSEHGATITLNDLVMAEKCVFGEVEIINLQDPKHSKAWVEEFRTLLWENLK